MNTYVFDLDGTLANIEHRLHFIQGDEKDWNGFYAACTSDKPIPEMIRLFRDLRNLNDDNQEMVVLTGRSDAVRQETGIWLSDNKIHETRLVMRKTRDYRPDHIIKEEWLKQYGAGNIICVFEDRKSVVDMWRRNGVMCMQVAEGYF